MYFDNVRIGNIFLRGESTFLKVDHTHAECIVSGYDFDIAGEVVKFGSSVWVKIV